MSSPSAAHHSGSRRGFDLSSSAFLALPGAFFWVFVMQPLVNDLLPCKNNRVYIPNASSFYLDKSKDDFWNEYACSLPLLSLLILDALFPEAIEANKSRMDDIVKRVESVRSMTSGSAPAGHQTSTLSALSASHSAAEERRGVASRASGAEKGAGEAHDDYERYAEDAVREC